MNWMKDSRSLVAPTVMDDENDDWNHTRPLSAPALAIALWY